MGWMEEREAKKAEAERTVAQWNERHPVGAPVIVHRDNGEDLATKTRSAALSLGGHSPVVFVDGLAGCYALTHVEPTDNEGDQLVAFVRRGQRAQGAVNEILRKGRR